MLAIGTADVRGGLTLLTKDSPLSRNGAPVVWE